MVTSGLTPPPLPRPVSTEAVDPKAPAHRRLPRLAALIEVVLCSGFPTQLLLAVVLSAGGLPAIDQNGQLSLAYVATLSSADAVLLIGLVLLFLRSSGERPRDVFLGARSVRGEIMLGLRLIPVFVVAAVLTLSVIRLVWPFLHNVQRNPMEAMIGSPLDALVLTVVAVVAGGCREEMQRAFILHRFDQHLGGGWVGLVLFSIAFGLGHYIQGWDAAIATGLLGAAWGVMYLLRRSAVAAVVSHAGFNLVEIVLAATGAAAIAVRPLTG